MNKIKVSEMDELHLKLIRENVKNAIQRIANIFDKNDNVVLDIAPQDHQNSKNFFLNAKLNTLDINPMSGADYIADICKNNFEIINEEQFDLVICTEVLEHTLNPFLAVEEVFRILKKGGTALFSTPLNFRIHGPLPDCWRFTEYGLRELLKCFSSVEINELKTENRDLFPVHYIVLAKK